MYAVINGTPLLLICREGVSCRSAPVLEEQDWVCGLDLSALGRFDCPFSHARDSLLRVSGSPVITPRSI